MHEALQGATEGNPLVIGSVGDSVGANIVNRQVLSSRLDAAGIPHEFVGHNTDFNTTPEFATSSWGGESYERICLGSFDIDRGGAIGTRDEPALTQLLEDYNPDLILVIGGNNNTNRPIGTTANELDLLLDKLVDAQIPVVFTNVPQHDINASGWIRPDETADMVPIVNNHLNSIIPQHSDFIEFTDINSKIGPEHFNADGLHLNTVGQTILGNCVADALGL